MGTTISNLKESISFPPRMFASCKERQVFPPKGQITTF